jgi:hypothetical protein
VPNEKYIVVIDKDGTSDKQSVDFNVATGADPMIPPIKGAEQPGVYLVVWQMLKKAIKGATDGKNWSLATGSSEWYSRTGAGRYKCSITVAGIVRESWKTSS